ncbi:MAG TPA: Ig-like domain-containing protein [Candidatus Dormibacteraeota bacterium]|nr:Ig-like domain-containing protein [Candidatus Dormibacteraeota bacterium]
MSTKRRLPFRELCYSAILFCLLPVLTSRSQTSNSLIPLVTIWGTDPLATWSGDPGTFTLFRAGPTNTPLNVYCVIGGTASNGVDYTSINAFTLIPAGERSSTITIAPINHGQTDTRTVGLTLAPSPLAGAPINYTIGYPSNATVYIRTNGANVPPWVDIMDPTNDEVFVAPVDIRLLAFAGDVDGFVTSVEFFADGVSLGVVSNFAIIDPLPSGGPPPGTRAFFFDWINAPAGGHTLVAKATDDDRASSSSDPVHIRVLARGTNLPTVVRITSPANGAVFHAPVNIPILAYAHDPDDAVASVAFFAGQTDLGAGHLLNVAGSTAIPPTNVYFLLWSNAPAGIYPLTAVATDTRGLASTSDPVTITIVPPRPPPTNRPPIVNLVASDPIAIEGTNCWVWPGLTNPVPAWSNWISATAFRRLFTNCGPKDALFTVHRLGSTNETLTVNYAIGGTASNGVDYVALPGSVTFAAGQVDALIPIVPIDDGPPDISSTVILKLTPDPDYVVGYPPKAAALIFDGPCPRATAALPGGCFRVNAAGPDGAWFYVEYSTDLLHWTPICTNQVVQGSIDFIDPDASSEANRFYRVIPDSAPRE